MANQTSQTLSCAMVIGVAGGSGSGKTTFARMIQANLGEHFCAILSQDFYYRDRHEDFDCDGGKINFDHPDSIEFSLLVKHLKALKEGANVIVPRYDFATHQRLEMGVPLNCRPVIIVDGILILTQPELRDLFDFSFFIETHEDLRFQRRLSRDVRERGRTPEGVREQFFNHVKPMHDQFVAPSKAHAQRMISGERSFGPVIEDLVFGIKGSHPPSVDGP